VSNLLTRLERERAADMREAYLAHLRAGWSRKTPRTMQGRMVHFVPDGPGGVPVCDAFVINESKFSELVKVTLFRRRAGPVVVYAPRKMLQFKPHRQEAA
jgi:hypothetical protein